MIDVHSGKLGGDNVWNPNYGLHEVPEGYSPFNYESNCDDWGVLNQFNRTLTCTDDYRPFMIQAFDLNTDPIPEFDSGYEDLNPSEVTNQVSQFESLANCLEENCSQYTPQPCNDCRAECKALAKSEG